jgi:Ctr copper transporter family
LNLLAPSWLLKTPWKFHGALLYTFGLAVLVSAVSSIRVGVALHNDANSNRSAQVLLVFLYAIQALLGYALMLVVVTYSIELLLAAIAGLVTGHVVWASAQTELGAEDSNDEDEDEDEDNLPHDACPERQLLLSHVEGIGGTLRRR